MWCNAKRSNLGPVVWVSGDQAPLANFFRDIKYKTKRNLVQLSIIAGLCNETVCRLLSKEAGFGEPENAGY